MSDIIDLIGALLLLAGTLFLLLGGTGLIRMPDVYNRIQAGTKATTLGTLLVLLGLAVLHPAWTWKLLILAFFVLLTNPVSSHALARAAHTIHVPEADETVIDQLEEEEQKAAAAASAPEESK